MATKACGLRPPLAGRDKVLKGSRQSCASVTQGGSDKRAASPRRHSGVDRMNAIDRVVRGRIVLSDRIVEDGFLAIADGKVAQAGCGAGPAAASVENYRDCLVLPGAIDGQVHSRSQRDQ